MIYSFYKGMMYMLKLIAMDMDGTLLNDCQQITPYTQKKLISLQEQGVAVVLASGRDIQSLKEYGDILHLSDYPQSGYICLNGLMICDSLGDILYTHNKLTYEESLILEDLAHQYQLDMILFFEKTMFVIKYGNTGIIEHHFKAFQKYMVHHIQEIPQHYFQNLKKIAFIQKEEVLNQIIPSLQNEVKNQFDMCRVDVDWIEMNPYGIHKGFALKQYAHIKNIPLEEIIAFGNGENDIEMLKIAGKGIAMENSFENVQKIADDICGNCNDDGIGQYLTEKYG